MEFSPTLVMRRGNRGRRAVMGALLVAALLGLGALLLPNGAYAASEAKPKPKISKGKAKAKYKKAKHKKPKVSESVVWLGLADPKSAPQRLGLLGWKLVQVLEQRPRQLEQSGELELGLVFHAQGANNGHSIGAPGGVLEQGRLADPGFPPGLRARRYAPAGRARAVRRCARSRVPDPRARLPR
jgi:hypothetical protein